MDCRHPERFFVPAHNGFSRNHFTKDHNDSPTPSNSPSGRGSDTLHTCTERCGDGFHHATKWSIGHVCHGGKGNDRAGKRVPIEGHRVLPPFLFFRPCCCCQEEHSCSREHHGCAGGKVKEKRSGKADEYSQFRNDERENKILFERLCQAPAGGRREDEESREKEDP